MGHYSKLFNVSEKYEDKILFDSNKIKNALGENTDFLIVKSNGKIGILNKNLDNFDKDLIDNNGSIECIGYLPNILKNDFGNENFIRDYSVKYAYMGGSMANEISSPEMVIAFTNHGLLCSLGTGGVSLEKIESDILEIKKNVGDKSFCCNILNAPQEPEKEQKLIDLYLKCNINIIEASAFINLSLPLVYYRLNGLKKDIKGNIVVPHHIIAKISRDKIAKKFMEPAPEKLVKKLLELGKITNEEAELSKFIPMADDITAESDSGGHTDNRQFTSLYTVIKNLRDEVETKYNYSKHLRVGIGGGIGTPESLLAAFEMGADYVVLGSVNQSCIESGTSIEVKDLLSKAEYTDMDMAPAADMFEMGAKVQVLKKGTLYPMRARHLFEIYNSYESINDIPKNIKEKIEKEYFQKTLEEVWEETKNFFIKINNLDMLEKAEKSEKKKMALVFRWYLGQSPNWGRRAVLERKQDYQIWAGASLGAFNDWAKNTEFNEPKNRKVVDITERLFSDALILKKMNYLRDFYKFKF